ncbi:MAG: hypothetical protein ACRETT_06500 [Steroidobacteraceae bacterium]
MINLSIRTSALSVLLVFAGSSAVRADEPQSSAAVTPLISRDLTGIPGKEAVMMTVEYLPGGASRPHRHDAHVFVYVPAQAIRLRIAAGVVNRNENLAAREGFPRPERRMTEGLPAIRHKEESMTASHRNALLVLLTLGAAGTASAADEGWSLLLEPMFMDAYGHDQHVMTVHEVDLGATPPTDTQTPVTLDNESGPGYRFELQYARNEWALGLDFFWFNCTQGRPSRTAAASGPAGPIDQVVFETADRSVTSDVPSEVLQFNVLEDTDIAAWTVDLYALKPLSETPTRGLDLQFGLRNADFDNDYHSVAATQNVAGSFLDASSNYGRMIGPLLGLSGEVHFGRNTISGYLGQSVVFGTAELSHMTRDFTGPIDAPAVVAVEIFRKEQDVAIPITEFRVNWLYPISRRASLGVSANTSIWWDVPVPPGVIPIADGNDVFHENTILYFGLAIAVKLRI